MKIGDFLGKVLDRKEGRYVRAAFLAPIVSAFFCMASLDTYLAESSRSSKIGSRTINNAEELNSALREEREKLPKLKGKNISVCFSDRGSFSHKVDSDNYEIHLSNKLGRNVSTLRHELYHISEGHFGTRNGLKQSLYFEPAAIEYARLESKQVGK